MLNGIDPIIIFNFKKNFLDPTASNQKIPVGKPTESSFPLPAIPIYLSETISGITIDTEDKNIDVDTNVEQSFDGLGDKTNQRMVNSSVKITMQASKDSIGVSLFAALTDLIVPKITSREYSITYLHGAVVVFAGLLHSFSINQNNGTDLYNITIEIAKPSTLKQAQPQVANDPKSATLSESVTAVKR